MAGIFETANKAVVEAAYDRVEVLVAAAAVTGDMSIPTTESEGVSLLGASRAIVTVYPTLSAATCDAEVYAYFDGLGWRGITELGKTAISEATRGDAWKANIGGATRIYVRVLNISGGAVDAHVLRSYV